MAKSNPVISFLTPTYFNPQLLRRAVDALCAQDCPDWEMVISPDDGGDYSPLLEIDARVRLANADAAVGTGPGPARNRALACATGEFVTCLDDDDTVPANFVAACLESLKKSPVLLIPSLYVTSGLQPVRAVATEISQLDVNEFAKLYATLHVVGPRKSVKPWTNYFAEDVLHTSVAIENNGGRMAVVSGTRYQITLRDGSQCATRPDIVAAYQRLIDGIESTLLLSELSVTARKNIRNLFSKRIGMQQRFELRQDLNVGYQDFVQQYLNGHA